MKVPALADCFKTCLEGLTLAGKHLSIDGKELRGTTPLGKKHALVQMVNEWAAAYKVSLGQFQLATQSNEITAIPQMLELMECEGSLISIEAGPADKRAFGSIGCQKSIVETIRGKKAD